MFKLVKKQFSNLKKYQITELKFIWFVAEFIAHPKIDKKNSIKAAFYF